jgi:hypothetical protein
LCSADMNIVFQLHPRHKGGTEPSGGKLIDNCFAFLTQNT